MKFLLTGIAIVLVFSLPAFGRIIHVPADQPTIQAGIDAAIYGDTLLVAAGTYTGDGNREVLPHFIVSAVLPEL